MIISEKGDEVQASQTTLESLADHPRWVAWQLEKSGDRITKVPYSPRTGRKAKADDPSTWGTMSEAYDRYERLPKLYDGGGIGLELSELGDGWSIGGVDLDTCLEDDGNIATWAQDIIRRFQTYGEVSPSRTGVKLFFLYETAGLSAIRHIMQSTWGKMFKRGGGEHPPAIEVHLGNRYFATTADSLDVVPLELRHISSDDLRWLLQQAGPAFVGNDTKPLSPVEQDYVGIESEIGDLIAQIAGTYPALQRYWAGDFSGLADQSRSGLAMALGAALKRAGLDFDEMCAALGVHPATSAWVADKGELNDQRELKRIWDKVVVEAPPVSESAEPSRAILERTMQPSPALPLAAFGQFWGDWVQHAAAGANAPVDYTALALLSLASAVIGNSRWVKAWDGWAEPPVLWCCGVGDPSSGKTSGASPVNRDVLSKVEDWMARDYALIHETWMARNTAAVARKKVWEKAVEDAIKAGDEPPPLSADVNVEDEPKPPCVRVGNITIEQMMNILARQPKGLLCANDELSQWFSNFQRYSFGSDRPFWLEAYNGGSFRLDRVNRAEPVRIPRLSVALFGTIQPERLADVLRQSDDGLVSRFLFAWPEPIPFKRPTAHANIQAATNALCRLADIVMSRDECDVAVPSFVPLADDAAEVFEVFAKSLAEREHRSHGLMKGIIGKARGQTLRLALVLEFLWWCGGGHTEPAAIHKRSMEAAIELMDTYFLPMATRVLGDAAETKEERDARLVARWVVDTKPDTVNISAIRDRAHLPGLRETKDVKAAVRYLVEAKWLIEAPHYGAGRPRGDYTVNPKLWQMLPTAR